MLVIRLSACVIAGFLLSACANLNDPYRPDPYYSDPYRRSDYDRYRYEQERDYRREREIQRERERLADERDRLERERQRLEREKYTRPTQRPAVTRPPKRETCPPGFYPSEQKCTDKERKRGCKDIRLPGGLGCRKG